MPFIAHKEKKHMGNIIVIKIGGVASQHLSQDFINQIKNWKEAASSWLSFMVAALRLIN